MGGLFMACITLSITVFGVFSTWGRNGLDLQPLVKIKTVRPTRLRYPTQKNNRAGKNNEKTHRLVRFKTGAGCRDAKSSKKPKISNSVRQLIYQPASHLASHSILTSYLHIVHVFLIHFTTSMSLSPLQLFLFPCSGISCFYCG